MSAYVHHNKWFNVHFGDAIFQCKIVDHGYSYGTMWIRRLQKMKKRKKYFLFGPEIEVPVYVTITFSHKGDNIPIGIDKQKYYSSYHIKQKVESILRYFPITSGAYEHTENI